jgi:hypothetical protein
MKIPKKLKIGGHIYTVKHRDRFREDGVEKTGSCLSVHTTLWIDNNPSKSQQESTLIHEILEALNNENELNLTHQQISTLECGLYQVLKDNRLLNEKESK